MIDFSVAWDKLAQFQSADELAEFFASEHIKATKGDTTACAISVWMQQTTGQSIRTTTDSTNQYVENENGVGMFTHSADHTKAMVEFVDEFDLGTYPNLVKDSSPW